MLPEEGELILHLGVVDVPYNEPPAQGRRPKKVAAGTQTTGDVAEWLEDKYRVMGTFVDNHLDDVARTLGRAMAGHLENLLMGAPASPAPLAGATSAIERDFHKFLESQEMDRLGVPGVPTEASLQGISHRFKNPRFKVIKGKKVLRDPRPSFIDTGIYVNSFTAWTEEK